jgi:hypothetical protein
VSALNTTTTPTQRGQRTTEAARVGDKNQGQVMRITNVEEFDQDLS